MADDSFVRDLVWNPRESLGIELKAWFDPKTSAGQAKIARFALGMRNHGGGFMAVGFDDRSHAPVSVDRPADVRAAFHSDTIQGIVTRFASESFEITVHFVERDGFEFPVIEIPPGVKTPVAAKSSLEDGGRTLVACHRVYVRSLDSNGTASTTEAGWKDWARVLETCFDNREADIGRFLRRHLAGLSRDALREALAALREESDTPAEPTIEERLTTVLDAGLTRFQTMVKEKPVQIPLHGSWEVAAIVRGAPPLSADLNFRNALLSSNPNLTGWPVWVDSRDFGNEEFKPYVVGDAWEAFIPAIGRRFGGEHLDFWRLSARAEFYLYRAFQDDMVGGPQRPEPLTEFDFGLPLLRTTEALAVGLDFAKALGAPPDSSSVAFAFRWRRLKGRTLTNWAQPERVFSPGRRAYRDEVVSFTDVPVDTPRSSLHSFMLAVTKPLYEAFDGFEIPVSVAEDFARRLFQRRL